MSDIAIARDSEAAYHEALYRDYELFEAGSWLVKPATYAIESFGLLRGVGLRVLDLGAGVGRHAIPAAQHFGSTARVVGIDLLETAIQKLQLNAARFGLSNIVGIQADVESCEVLTGPPFDLVLSVSCVEHVPTRRRLQRLLCQLQMATRPGGVHCFMLMTDNEWVDPASGMTVAPLLEQNLNSSDAINMLRLLYKGWTIHDLSTKLWQVPQLAFGRDMVLKSTCVQFTAQKFV